MGLIIVTTVGAILGWLLAIVVERDGHTDTPSCAMMGAVGATVGALVTGSVSLFTGVSATQLLGALIGAIVAILLLITARSLLTRGGRGQSLPTRRDSGTPAPIRR